LARIFDRFKVLYQTIVIAAVQVWRDFSDDNGSQAAAAFSFYCFLSLLALLILAGAVLGMVLSGNPELLGRIMDYISQNLSSISDTVKEALQSSIDLKGVLGLAGALGLLYTGTKIFDSFQVWLNAIWGVEKPKYLRKKLKSLLTLCFTGVVVALGLGLHLTLFIAHRYFDWLGSLMSILVFLITTLMLFTGLLFIYSYSIEAKLGWKVVWKGALFSALLINPVQMVLGWYYSRIGDFSAIYGSFASIVLTIIIIYYVGYIIYMGAELNRFLDTERSRPHRSHVRT
jgi:membrane protein